MSSIYLQVPAPSTAPQTSSSATADAPPAREAASGQPQSGGPQTPPPYWPASGVLPFSHAHAASAPPAVRSGLDSVDGTSVKSDGLAGDEVEALQGHKDHRDAMRQYAAPWPRCSACCAVLR
jgi:hypothetical protein